MIEFFENIFFKTILFLVILILPFVYLWLYVPASWLEILERPVLLVCKSSSKSSKLISFTPYLGKIIYDGSEVNGEISHGVVRFSFTNVNEEKCEWTISRIDGSGQTSCKNKDDNYSFDDLKCEINKKQLF